MAGTPSIAVASPSLSCSSLFKGGVFVFMDALSSTHLVCSQKHLLGLFASGRQRGVELVCLVSPGGGWGGVSRTVSPGVRVHRVEAGPAVPRDLGIPHVSLV